MGFTKAEIAKNYRERHKDEVEFKERMRVRSRVYYQQHKASIITNVKAYRSKNQQWYKEMHQRRRTELRLQVLSHYTNGTLKCQCDDCNVIGQQFLTIEHINGGGRKDRLKYGNNARNFYASIVQRGFPKELTALCFNCNCAKSAHGYCHKRS